MQPVAHIVELYRIKLAGAASWRQAYLRAQLKHYQVLCAPRYSLRYEDTANKLLENHQIDLEELIDADEIANPEPTALQHFIDSTESNQ